jgi:cysteine synthase
MNPSFVYGPTFEEMLHPEKINPEIRKRALLAFEDKPLDALNLYNITWKDEKNKVRHVILPKALTNIDAEIVVLIGKYFPTGSHKVGATYSCTVEKQVKSKINPGRHCLVWPSTGNYGIGGAYIGPRMGYKSLVILPEKMSKERFEKIKFYGADYIATPGCESNVKEIYDKTHELARIKDTIIVNQFAEFGNYRFHYYVTGNSILELFDDLKKKSGTKSLAAFCSAMGSAGTIAAGDRLKQVHPDCRIVGLEPVQCPTLYNNGFGDHDIQGIGDKHVTWIHHTDNMDAIICIDDVSCKKGLAVIAEEEGWKALNELGITTEETKRLSTLFGISGICNILGAIKAAKFYKFGKGDVIFTIATDSLDRYYSVLKDMTKQYGKMDACEAENRIMRIFHGVGLDWIREGDRLTHDCWANLKYYTWVEQQGKSADELRAQRNREYWEKEQAKIHVVDKLIKEQRGI